MKLKLIAFTTLLLFVLGCQKKGSELTPTEAQQIAKEAYIYGFPLVLNYKTMYDYAVNTKSPEYKGDFNQISSEARVFTPEDKTIITPNSDTP